MTSWFGMVPLYKDDGNGNKFSDNYKRLYRVLLVVVLVVVEAFILKNVITNINPSVEFLKVSFLVEYTYRSCFTILMSAASILYTKEWKTFLINLETISKKAITDKYNSRFAYIFIITPCLVYLSTCTYFYYRAISRSFSLEYIYFYVSVTFLQFYEIIFIIFNVVTISVVTSKYTWLRIRLEEAINHLKKEHVLSTTLIFEIRIGEIQSLYVDLYYIIVKLNKIFHWPYFIYISGVFLHLLNMLLSYLFEGHIVKFAVLGHALVAMVSMLKN